MPGISGMLRVMARGPFEEALRTLQNARPGPVYTALVTPPTSTSEAYMEVNQSFKKEHVRSDLTFSGLVLGV